MLFMHRGGSHSRLGDSAAIITTDPSMSQNPSSMSQSCTGVIQALVEAQQRQNDLMQRGFDRLVQCLSEKHGRFDQCFSPKTTTNKSDGSFQGFFEGAHEDIEIEEDDGDTSLSVMLKRPDGRPREFNIPTHDEFFKDLGGASRKTEEKNTPLLLLELVVTAAWFALLDEKKFFIPFILDWSSKDKETDYVKDWLSEIDRWSAGHTIPKKLGAAIVFVDSKPCLAVYHKFWDPDKEVMKPKFTMVIPQSLKKSDLPQKEVQMVFEKIFLVGEDTHCYEMTKIFKVFPADDNVQIQNTGLAAGIMVKSLILKFSEDKRARGRNEFSDAVFWLVTLGGTNTDNFFSGLLKDLIAGNENNDPAAYRHSVCQVVYESIMFLAQKGIVSLLDDPSASSEEVKSALQKQSASTQKIGKV
jgi:hypothetical protein